MLNLEHDQGSGVLILYDLDWLLLLRTVDETVTKE